MRFTIRQKGLVLIGVPILFQLMFVGLFLKAQNDAAAIEHWALHTKDVIAQTEKSYRSLLQAFSDTRGAVLLGHALDAGGLPDALSEIDQLKALVVDNPPQAQRVDLFHQQAADELAWMQHVLALLDQGKRDEATTLVEDPASVARMRDLRGHLDHILDTEQTLNAQRMTDVARVRNRIRWLLGAALALGLLLAVAMLAAFSKSIAGRMLALADNARALGERRPLGPPIGGADEITDVDVAFHAAADQLQKLDAAEKLHRHELERRAAELARVNQDLSVKTRENETFVYSVSHDLRSPLVNLQGFSRELLHACDDLRQMMATSTGISDDLRRPFLTVLDGDVKESVTFIQTAVTRSANIIDALLRLSRAGRVEYNWGAVAIRPIVDRIVSAMQSTIREHGADVSIVGELPDAYGDATAIEQILGNLIGNAVNYLDPNRPGRVEVGALPDLSDPPADRPGGHRLRTYFVRDNGLGIPEAYLPKVFVAFQRLHGAMAPGEGIGLALVRRMVERHGGKVWVESVEGQGSTFFVALPTPNGSPAGTAATLAAIGQGS